jgi:hypothetical protein
MTSKSAVTKIPASFKGLVTVGAVLRDRGIMQYFRKLKILPLQSQYIYSRHYQKKKVVGLERGPLSLVTTTKELLDRKVAAPV